MAGLFNGNWDQGQGILPSGDAGMTYPPYTQVPAAAAPPAAYSPQFYPSEPTQYQNYSPAAPQMTAQPMGFMDRINGALSNPLTQFGLGLASGRTPQEGIGNALQSTQFRQKLEHEKMTAAMKEYQYSISTGGIPPGTTFPQFLQMTQHGGDKSSLNTTIVQNPDTGRLEAWQLHSKGGATKLDFGGAEPTVPYKPIDTGQGTLMAPNRGAPGLPLPGAAAVPTDPSQSNGAYIPKDIAGGAQQKRIGTETAVAMQRLPAIETTTERALSRLDALDKHPGLDAATGFLAGKLPFAPTPAARDAVARIQEIQGEAWTQGIETMRGLGALSDAEGRRIEQARSRLSARDVSKEDYRKAIRDVADIMRTGRDNARKIASGQMKPFSTGENDSGDSGGWTALPGGVRIRQK